MNIRNISSNQIIIWSVLVIGLLSALLIGSAIGSSDVRMVAGVIAIVPIAVIFVKLKTNIWVLLPISWYLAGRLPWLPLPLTVRDLCFMVVILFFSLFFATRALPWRRKPKFLDYLIYINLAYLASVYVRYPAGFWALQTDIVGGRPYFEIVLAFGAFAILSRVNITDFIARIFPLFFVIPAWCIGILDVVGRLIPQAAVPLSMIYSGVASAGVSGVLEQEQKLGETRMTGLQVAGSSSVLALCSKYNPITLITPLYPFRVLLFAFALGTIFLSGFRSMILFAMVTFLLSALLRGNFKDLWISGAMLSLALLVLVSAQGSMIQLPKTAQRALSWLPGDWDQEAVTDAEGSTRWRIEMWEWAWNDERIIRDKVWGTGFGLSLDDMSLIAASLMAGQGGGSLLGGSDRESFMITGTFHSGPLSTIKYIGAVGLALYYSLLCYMAFLGVRLCKQARGTKALPLALFVCIPVIWEPVHFVAVFGALENNYPETVFYAGLINLLGNYLNNCKKAIIPENRSKLNASKRSLATASPVI